MKSACIIFAAFLLLSHRQIFFAATGFLRGKGSQGSNGRTGLQDLIRDLRQGPKDLRPDAPTSKNRIKEEPVEGKIVAIVQLEMDPGTTL